MHHHVAQQEQEQHEPEPEQNKISPVPVNYCGVYVILKQNHGAHYTQERGLLKIRKVYYSKEVVEEDKRLLLLLLLSLSLLQEKQPYYYMTLMVSYSACLCVCISQCLQVSLGSNFLCILFLCSQRKQKTKFPVMLTRELL